MIGRMFTVGGLTLLSRATGFARDIVLAAILGAGPIADAFFVALRLPNHFRAIFAEGAFNAAFLPAYARIRQQGGADPAKLFADRVFTLLLASQVVLLAIAWLFTPAVISALAPGFSKDPGRFALAVELTRITFPYLLLISLVTLYGGVLNALGRFATPGRRPDLAESVDDQCACARRRVPDRRPCRGLGGARCRPARSIAGRCRCLAQRRSAATAVAIPGRGRQGLSQAAGAGDRRLGRDPDCIVRRHHHCELSRDWCALGALLRGSPQPASHRRDRNCRRDGAAARDGKSHCRR